MNANFDDPLEADVLMAAMQMDKAQVFELLETLASKFEQALPEQTEVVRGGGLFSKKKVEQLTLRFDDMQYQLVRQRTGTLGAKEMKVVRGIVLKTSDITIDECIKRIAQQLASLAETNARVRQTLQQFLIG